MKPIPLGSRLRRYLVRSFITTLTLLFLGSCAATCRPATYRPHAIDYARLPADKQSLADMLQSVADRLNTNQPAEIVLDQEQVNRWIAARYELWPAEQLPELPAVESPQVRFLGDGKVEVAALASSGGLRAVVTLTARVRLDENGVHLAPDSARIGALPAPIFWLGRSIRAGGPIQRAGSEIEFDKFGSWPNGRRPFEIVTLEISDGRARVVLKPTAP